jgi:hypothetical protein
LQSISDTDDRDVFDSVWPAPTDETVPGRSQAPLIVQNALNENTFSTASVSSMNIWVRWLMVAPASLLAWVVTLFVGIFFSAYVETLLCPPEDFISGYCDNEMVRTTVNLVFSVFAGLSAVAVILAAVVTAPANKTYVAWVSLVIGSAIAISMLGISKDCAVAIAGGTLAAAITMYFRKRETAYERR